MTLVKLNSVCLVKLYQLGSTAMAASLPRIFHQLKTKSRSAELLFTRSIKMSVGMEKENIDVYSLRPRRNHSSNRLGDSGLLTFRRVMLSHIDFTAIRQISSFDKYWLISKLELKGLTRKQAEDCVEIVTDTIDEQCKHKALEQKTENEWKLKQFQIKIDTEFETIKIKLQGFQELMDINFKYLKKDLDLFKFETYIYSVLNLVFVIIIMFLLIALLEKEKKS